ncbi:hypothetical protein NL676_007714 [Syzygium grande]|nr:hypothetical protein NL676_007714 [Syzygium grande]
MGTFLGFAVTMTLLFCMAQGEVLHYDFVVKETPIDMLCETNRTILTVNDLFPGPEIRAHKGDIIYVNVTNIGPYGITIHWHGVRQIRYPWSDGPEYVTQCPIPTNSSFLQKIILTDEEGTLWWHAHSDWSRATLHGPIIILPVNDTNYPYEFDEQHTIVISEWFGRQYNGCARKTYLLRIIHSGLNEEMFFGIAEHNITVVGMDGAYLKPLNTDYLMITPGQTMDVLVIADQTPGRYYMVFSPFVDTTAPGPMKTGPDGGMHSASLNNISFWAPSISILQAYYNNLKGVYNKTFPDEPPFVFDYTGNVSAIGEAANVSTEVLMINYNEEVEIRFQGTNLGAAENHPMHLHGYSFYVVGMGDGNFSDSYVSDYNTVDPPYINTAGLPKMGGQRSDSKPIIQECGSCTVT